MNDMDKLIAELREWKNNITISAYSKAGDEFDEILSRHTPKPKDEGGLREALSELYALVKGECPSLLNEDSGGDARLDMQIQEALSRYRPAPSSADEGLNAFSAWFALFVARLYDNGTIKSDDPMFEAYKRFRTAMDRRHPTPVKQEDGLVEALEKLARLGNGSEYGNSDGNRIAQDALAKYKGAK